LRLSAALIEEYIDLYHQLDIVAHRRDELENFLKKNVPPDNQEVQP
jgi:hypothetical protein